MVINIPPTTIIARLCCSKCKELYGLKEQCNAAITRTLANMGDDSNCSFCGKPNGGAWISTYNVTTPDHRNNGMYQYVKGWTGFGAEMCSHVSRDDITESCRSIVGDGILVDNGTKLYWVPEVKK